MMMNAETNVTPAPEQVTALTTVLWLMLAAFGGAVKYISTVIRSNENVTNRRFLWLLAANMLISSFCGLMGTLMVSTVTTEATYHGIAAGLLGYLGTQGLDIVLLSLKKKVGLPLQSVTSVVPVPPSVDPANS